MDMEAGVTRMGGDTFWLRGRLRVARGSAWRSEDGDTPFISHLISALKIRSGFSAIILVRHCYPLCAPDRRFTVPVWDGRQARSARADPLDDPVKSLSIFRSAAEVGFGSNVDDPYVLERRLLGCSGLHALNLIR
jgi:hypothetical protein